MSGAVLAAMLRSALACALVLLGGCSFLFTTPAPARVTAHTTMTCTTSRAAPAIDGILAAIEGIGTAVIANGDYANKTPYVVGGVLWTGVYIAAAIYGHSVVTGCEEAIAEHDRLAELGAPQARRLNEADFLPVEAPPPAPPPRPVDTTGLY